MVKIERIEEILEDMSVSKLIDMFMGKTYCTLHNRQNGLKRYNITWEQFLTERTVINDKESKQDTSQHKNKYEGKQRPAQDNHEMAIKKKNRRLLTHAKTSNMIFKFGRRAPEESNLRSVSALQREVALQQGLQDLHY